MGYLRAGVEHGFQHKGFGCRFLPPTRSEGTAANNREPQCLQFLFGFLGY